MYEKFRSETAGIVVSGKVPSEEREEQQINFSTLFFSSNPHDNSVLRSIDSTASCPHVLLLQSMPTQTAEQSQTQSTSAEATTSTETLNLHDEPIQSGSRGAAEEDRSDALVPTQAALDQVDSSSKGKQRADLSPSVAPSPKNNPGNELPAVKQSNQPAAQSTDSSSEAKTIVEDNEEWVDTLVCVEISSIDSKLMVKVIALRVKRLMFSGNSWSKHWKM